MAKLKVWGGLTRSARKPAPNGGTQARTIVAAKNQKRAVELLVMAGHGISLSEFRNYWCETGNELELAIAFCEGVWGTFSVDMQSKDFEWFYLDRTRLK